MPLKLENELLFWAADYAATGKTDEELRDALRYAWRLILVERERHGEFASEMLGVPVVCGGPLLPPQMRTQGCAA
jgi:hypothetical protein